MIRKAVVIDNSMFYERGVIRVKVAGYFMREMTWNLEEDFPNSIEEGEPEDGEYAKDMEALLTSPLGGGRNFGIFMLPQPNEKGLVAFLGQNNKRPIWLGSIFEPEYDDNFEVTHINIPSDLPEQEGEDTDGALAGEHNMRADEDGDQFRKSIVVRTKTTSVDSEEEINWQEQRTSNIVVLADKEMRARHFAPDGWDETTPQKWQEILMRKDEDDKESITSSVINEADGLRGIFKLNDNALTITIEGEENTFNMSGNLEEGFSINMNDEHIMRISYEDGLIIETSADALVQAANTHFDVDSFQIGDGSDSLVLYSQLKTIVEEIENHIHIAPSGPTTSALASNQAPLTSKTKKPTIDMESGKSTTD